MTAETRRRILTNAAKSFTKRNKKRIRQSLKIAGQSELVSNSRFPGDLNLKTEIFSAHAVLFTSMHVNIVTDFQLVLA